jgi:hypothetical protein
MLILGIQAHQSVSKNAKHIKDGVFFVEVEDV